jgi:Protein of unknown function (DUF1571)
MRITGSLLAVLLIVSCPFLAISPAIAQQSPVAQQSSVVQTVGAQQQNQPAQHPLVPCLNWAKQGLQQIDGHLKDYSATLIKQERIGGKLQPEEKVFLKVRHNPFSAYMYFLSPNGVKGREALYVEGANDGKLMGHEAPGLTNSLIGTVSLKPDGMMAMRGQRYPITEIGLRNLVYRLLEVGSMDLKYRECDVKYSDVKINGRKTLCIEVTHPVPRKNFRFHIAKIYIDDELKLPLRYEAWDWPKKPGDKPKLMEAYTYLDLKLNNGFTDHDFDPKNPKYNFDVE